jgi:hypothetical protein
MLNLSYKPFGGLTCNQGQEVKLNIFYFMIYVACGIKGLKSLINHTTIKAPSHPPPSSFLSFLITKLFKIEGNGGI